MILTVVTPIATPTAASGVDPTVALLTGAVAAAVVTVIAGFIASAIQSRRDHKRWVREQRMAAYSGYLSVAEQSFPLTSKTRAVWTAHMDSTASALSAVRVVGPKAVADAAEAHLDVSLDFGKQSRATNEAAAAGNNAAFLAEQAKLARIASKVIDVRNAYVSAAQKELGITD